MAIAALRILVISSNIILKSGMGYDEGQEGGVWLEPPSRCRRYPAPSLCCRVGRRTAKTRYTDGAADGALLNL